MRSIVLASTILAAVVAAPFAASAQNSMGDNKFCSKTSGDNAASPRCLYRTMDECNQAVKGTQGTCMQNPNIK